MSLSSDRKLVLVTRKTRFEALVARYNTPQQAKFAVERQGQDFSDFENEDANYKASVRCILESLSDDLSVHAIDRRYLPNYMFGKDDIVVAVGQDGLVVNVMKYLHGQPLIGVNPDEKRWDGVLLPFTPNDVRAVVKDVLSGSRASKRITLARVDLNDGQQLYAVNDFFIGQKTHVSARYELSIGGLRERQSSSGIIVSTGLGSTGWLKSVHAGAHGVALRAGGAPSVLRGGAFAWDSNYLVYAVREPYPSKWTGADLVYGRIDGANPFRVVSQMSVNGVIFSDGVEEDNLEFNAGTEAIVSVAEKKGELIV